MQPLVLRSYERKIVIALVLLLGLCSFIGYHAYREQKIYTLYLEDGKTILTGRTSQTYTQVVKYYAPCEEIYDDTMYVDERCVEQEAVPGVKEVTRITNYYNGKETDSKVLEENIVEAAVPKVVHIGTKERPKYIVPMEHYTISSSFGQRWGRAHEGVDMAVSTGETVFATAAGTVVRAEYYSGYGYCIDIDHGEGVMSRYGHLSRMDVSVGQTVEQGQQVGLSGNTGNSTGPHLHFEIRINNVPVNPCDYVEL